MSKREKKTDWEIVEMEEKEKAKFINDEIPFGGFSMDSTFFCIHCEKTHRVTDAKIVKYKNGAVLLQCADFPECDGTVLDWSRNDER